MKCQVVPGRSCHAIPSIHCFTISSQPITCMLFHAILSRVNIIFIFIPCHVMVIHVHHVYRARSCHVVMLLYHAMLCHVISLHLCYDRAESAPIHQTRKKNFTVLGRYLTACCLLGRSL